MALIAHAGYGFRVKISDIRNPELFNLISEQSRENFFDEESFYNPDFSPVDAFKSMTTWDYVELLEEVIKNSYPGILVSLPGYAEAEHRELCIVIKSTYLSAYGESTVLDPDVLADDDRALIADFAKTYFNNAARGWLIWPYLG